MIKKTLLSTLILIAGISTTIEIHAQPFPKDESSKITFMEVIEVDSMKKEELFQNASSWLSGCKKKVKNKMSHFEKDSINSKVSADFRYLVYTQSGVLTKISGAITYSLAIEMKDNRYRYVLTDFVFHPYKQNRNYEYAETGVKKPLEETKASGWQKNWNHHRMTAYGRAMDEIKILKTRVLEKETEAPASAPVATLKKSDW